jgi:flavodoxin
MKKLMFLACTMLTLLCTNATAKTLVVYYSYTGNCREIMTTLTSQIEADVLEIQPAEKGLKYDANGYALGTQLLNAIKAAPNNATSYPAIDPVTTSLNDYETIIIVTPLWWSQMAAIMQTYLFNYGSQMAGKNVGLIVSSASSGISGVVDDCKRLVPDGKYFSENLWINHSNHSNRATLIRNWLTAINYNTVTSIDVNVSVDDNAPAPIYDLAGRLLVEEPSKGIYIKKGKKIIR